MNQQQRKMESNPGFDVLTQPVILLVPSPTSHDFLELGNFSHHTFILQISLAPGSLKSQDI